MIASKQIRAQNGNATGEITLNTNDGIIRIVINNVTAEFPAMVVDESDIQSTIGIVREMAAHL